MNILYDAFGTNRSEWVATKDEKIIIDIIENSLPPKSRIR